MGEALSADLLYLGCKSGVGGVHDGLEHIFVRHRIGGGDQARQVQVDAPVFGQLLLQAGKVPLFFYRLVRHVGAHQVLEGAFA